MPYIFDIRTDTDIDTKPSKIAPVDTIAMTVGDLHASFTKFLYALVLDGIIDISSQNYSMLAELYYTPIESVTEALLEEFIQLIDSITLLNEKALVRAIGDETGDRGMNDLYILLLLDKLRCLQIEKTGISTQWC